MKMRMPSLIAAIAFILLVVAVPVLIISTTATVYSNAADLYKAGFKKYDISARTGINMTQLDQVAQKMADYFGGKSPTPQLTVTRHGQQFQLYSEKELIHLADVRVIIRLFFILQVISIVALIAMGVLVFMGRGLAEVLRGLQTGAAIAGLFTVVLIVWSMIDFNSLFLLFHYVSFSNNLWILDPTKDYLIMMFPEDFFNDSAILIVSSILIESLVIWILAFLIRRPLLKAAAASTSRSEIG
jgi:integral membrane protein (TIGR01906 family)